MPSRDTVMSQPQLRPVLRHLKRVIDGGQVTGLTDGQLLDRFTVHHEEAAFEVLVRRYAPMVLAAARGVLGDVHSAEDVMQAAFLVLARKAASIDRSRPLGNWLYTVTYRLALRVRTRAARRRSVEDRAAHARPEELLRAVCPEVFAVLDEELTRLPERYRLPSVLCYLEGKTHEQAARELNCPKGSMSRRIDDARQRLRERLVARGFNLAEDRLGNLLAVNAPVLLAPFLIDTTVR